MQGKKKEKKKNNCRLCKHDRGVHKETFIPGEK